MKAKILLAVVAMICVSATSGLAAAQNMPSLLKGTLQSYVESRSGMVFGHRSADGKVTIEVSGYQAPGVKMDERVSLGIGSNTKAFTTALIYKLQEEGKLSVTDTLNKWLPEMVSEFYPGEVTILQLMTHASGIYDPINNDSVATINSGYAYSSHEEAMKWQKANMRLPLFAPGTANSYSNMGYTLLGLIIEKASGTSYAKYLRKTIIDPLKLTGTFLHGHEPATNKMAGYWSDEEYVKEVPIGFEYVAWSAGSLYSTARDMLTWYHALFSGQVISKASLDQMTKVMGVSNRDGRDLNMASGLFKKEIGGREIIYHGGDTIVFSSDVHYIPSTGDVFFMATNSSSFKPHKLIDVVLEKYLKSLSNNSK